MTEYTDEERSVEPFMDYALEDEEGPIQDDNPQKKVFQNATPSTKFLQKGINQFNEVLAKKGGNTDYELLEEDGEFGEKTAQAAKDLIMGLPPEMKRWVSARLKKSVSNGSKGMKLPEGMNMEDMNQVVENTDLV